MRIRWLGWAGVEIEERGERIVVDPLEDATAVFAWIGERAAAMPRPQVIPPRAGALAGLLTHLHRDHADATALTAALATDASVHEPHGYGGSRTEQLAIAQADHELRAAELTRTLGVATCSGPGVDVGKPANVATDDSVILGSRAVVVEERRDRDAVRRRPGGPSLSISRCAPSPATCWITRSRSRSRCRTGPPDAATRASCVAGR